MKFNYDVNFQRGIIELMVNDVTFAQNATQYLKKDFFSNQMLSFFFDVVTKLVEEYDYASWSMMENEIFKFSPDSQEQYTTILKQIKEPTQARDYDYIRENLEKFAKKAIAFQINEKLIKAQSKDPDKIADLIMKDVESMNYLSFQKQDFMTLNESYKIMEESASKTSKVLSLGIPDIDDALGGGVPRETLTMAIGGTNVGKSIFLVNAAYNFIKNGHKVLMVTLEGEKRQSMLRMISRATQISYGKVRTNSLTDSERDQVKSMKDNYKDSLMVKHIAEFNYTIEDFCNLCRQVYKDFKFDAIVLDYGQIMGAKGRFNSIRERQMHVHRGLASMGAVHDAAVLTVAQGTRDAQSKNDKGDLLLRMTDVSECFEICRVASTVLTLNRSAQDEDTDKVRILLDKQRDGKKGVLQSCKTDMSFIGFYGDDMEGLGFMDDEQPIDNNLPGEVHGN
jgi:replicative DNA helicase